MFDMMKIMKQVQDMQSKVTAMQETLTQVTVTGVSGGGLVQVTMNGKGEMRSVKIDPSLMKPEDAEMLEDLIVAANTDAKAKADVVSQEKMKEVTAGLPIPPGMSIPGLKF
jgi:nucleoid-associated protein EbfC